MYGAFAEGSAGVNYQPASKSNFIMDCRFQIWKDMLFQGNREASQTSPMNSSGDDYACRSSSLQLLHGQQQSRSLAEVLHSAHLSNKRLESSQLAHRHGHLAHIVGNVRGCRHVPCAQSVGQTLLEGLHALRKGVLRLLAALLQVADGHQLLLGQGFHLGNDDLQKVQRKSSSLDHILLFF